MAARDDLDRLDHEMKRDIYGPMLAATNLATSSLFGLVRQATNALRRVARDQPLIALVFSFEIGFVVARFGRRHASR